MLTESAGAAEWIEADGLGGYASGTVSTIPTRRYHGLRVTAVVPPSGRTVLVAGCEAWVDGPQGRVALTSARYVPGVIHPDGYTRVQSFSRSPWPTWLLTLGAGVTVRVEIAVASQRALTVVRWTKLSGPDLVLRVRPLLAARDYHSLQRENDAADLSTQVCGDEQVVWQLYRDAPAVGCRSNGAWSPAPEWFRQFEYAAEIERGLDGTEDLASPGTLAFNLGVDPAVCVFGSDDELRRLGDGRVVRVVDGILDAERRRRTALGDALERAADQYIVRRGLGHTIIAGYPWFTDWGRDTFIAMRGLCLATGRQDIARDILLEWASVVDRGMLPNRFPDRGDAPEYNAVDASLWFVVVAGELLAASSDVLTEHDRRQLEQAVTLVLEGHAHGTRHGIRVDADGLLAAGEPGVQLTWMDARVGEHVVTPRIGKPVEVQALWINALAVGERLSRRWSGALAHARTAFVERFWNDEAGCLFDVVDVDHVRGRVDPTLRPNQLFAVGGLPLPVIEGERARQVVERVEADLWTPLGLRSLAPADAAYAPRYEGGPAARDSVYHQGTVWPWLIGPFIEAWVRTRGGTPTVEREARARFLAPLIAHLDEAGLGHVSEIADGDAPHRPRGCPFQAWSLGELIRVDRALAR